MKKRTKNFHQSIWFCDSLLDFISSTEIRDTAIHHRLEETLMEHTLLGNTLKYSVQCDMLVKGDKQLWRKH